MSTNDSLKVTGLLAYKLKQAQHMLRLRMDEALRTLNLTTPQYSVLAQLELRPGISNAALARASFITAPTMHSIVTNLEKLKFVKRKQDPHHGRILCTELTKEGIKTVQQAHERVREAETCMLSTVSQEDRVCLERILMQCINNLTISFP